MECRACKGYGWQGAQETIFDKGVTSIRRYRIVCPSCRGSGTIVDWWGTGEEGYPRSENNQRSMSE